MSELQKLIISTSVIYHIVGIIVLCYYENKSRVYDDNIFACYLNPVWLYQNYKINYFGCLVLTILFNIACPLLSITYWTCKFIKWLFTVGRRK